MRPQRALHFYRRAAGLGFLMASLGKSMFAKRNVAATEHPLASMAALRVFDEGGNAFDAAAAASFALAVTQFHLNGLGGDFFGLLYSAKDRKVHCLNGSGWSPGSLTVGQVEKDGEKTMPLFGYKTVVIPGFVGGVCGMQKRFGSLELSDCLKDAINLAEEGFPTGFGLYRAFAREGITLPREAERALLGRSQSYPGRPIIQKELAACLREISGEGADGFYEGTAAGAIIKEMARGGIVVDEADLADYSPEWCDPLEMEYNGTRVFEVPPNSMGATALLMLKLLEEEKLSNGKIKPDSAERIEVTVRAAKAAYAARDAKLGDPRFMKGGFSLDAFLDVEGTRKRGRATRIRDGDTTYFCVADEEGNLLSCIQSLFHHFGSRVYVKKCGFFLNNRGSAFNLAGGPNLLEPRKRPLHTLSAVILAREGRPFVSVGASGGDFRPQQHALFVTNIVDYSMDIQQAIDYPRFLWEGGEKVRVEGEYGTPRGLEVRRLVLGSTGVAQGIEKTEEYLRGACDIRGEGLPAGA